MDRVDIRKHENLFCSHSRNETPEQNYFFAHVHSEIEIYYLVEGNVEYHVENNVYQLKPGDIMITRPGEVHTAYVTGNAPYERFSLRFSPELFHPSHNSSLLSPFMQRPVGMYNHYSGEEFSLAYIRSSLDRIFMNKQSDNQQRFFSYLIPILQEIYDIWIMRKMPQGIERSSLTAKIMTYINENLLTLKNTQQIADAMYMSQSQLYRVFRAHAGLSAWDYVRIKRLFTAQEMLRNGIHPSNAATECGFQEYSTFYRAYKKQFGHKPQDDQCKQL